MASELSHLDKRRGISDSTDHPWKDVTVRQGFWTRTQCDLRDAVLTVLQVCQQPGHGCMRPADQEDDGHLQALRPPLGSQAIV